MTDRPGVGRSSRHFLNILAMLIVVFVIGTLFGANSSRLLGQFGLRLGSDPFDKLGAIHELVNRYHVRENVLDDEQAVDDAIRGMLSRVDGGYTRYETAAEAAQFDQTALQGTYSGIGIQSMYLPDELRVEIVFRGSPPKPLG